MARVCTVCSHPDLELVDAALVAGVANRRIASHHGLTEASIRRHKADHLPETLTKAHDAAEVARADVLLDSMKQLQAHAVAILEGAMTGTIAPRFGERGAVLDLIVPTPTGAYALPELALKAMKEARANLELLAILEGELNDGSSQEVTVTYVNDWRTGAN